MPQVFPHLHVVLLCEDYGERLWPIAREQSPACFAAAGPDSSDTMLAAAVKRTKPFTEHPLHVVTTQQLAPSVTDLLLSEDLLADKELDLVIEPVRRGSAVSVALVTAAIRRKDPQAVILITRTDQQVTIDDRWERILFKAYQVALEDRIVIVGSEQREKAADFSYVRRGKALPQTDDVFDVRVFQSDQPANAARRACEQGAYWYTGVVMARAAVILGELSSVGESGRAPLNQSGYRIAETANFLSLLLPQQWLLPEAVDVVSTLPTVSFEKAVLEGSTHLAVVPTTIPFSTLSSLEDLDSLEPANRQGNRAIGRNVQAVGCKNTTLFTQESTRQVVGLGLRDVLVVDTPDALLVTTKEQLQVTKDLFAAAQGDGAVCLKAAARRPFAWGSATLLERTPAHATWRVQVRPGCSAETFVVPFAFEAFDKTSLKEQYVVLEGEVSVNRSAHGGPSDHRLPGDAFEAEMPRPRRITALGEKPALLLLSVVVK